MSNIFTTADILVPKNNDAKNMNKWSVVACDQYTSEPDYWEKIKADIGDSNSTLKMVFPEVYLKNNDFLDRIKLINNTMDNYIENDIFKEYKNALFFIERTQHDKKIRHGIIGMVDLEEYDFSIGSTSYIRATEGTVLDRIPPRVQIRQNASLESPHVMLLIDDPNMDIIESISQNTNALDVVYDFNLMVDSGYIKGYRLDDKNQEEIFRKLDKLADVHDFNKKYGVHDKPVLLFAVGDGNHSLATARQCYLNQKEKFGDAALNSPARYALVEIVNLHSTALEFEAIHRVLFNVDPIEVLNKLESYFDISYDTNEIGDKITMVINKKTKDFIIKNPKYNLPVANLQEFIDFYFTNHTGEVDYIHGDDVTINLTSNDNTIGFILDSISKNDLFKTVILDGSLPRKTFSMGHAYDKRFYLECRKIK